MGISADQAREPFLLLRGQAGWKDTEREIKQFLAKELARIAETPYHAEQICRTWIERERFLPTPADFLALAGTTEKYPPPKPTSTDCPICHGSGRESYWVLLTLERYEDTGRIKRRKIERIPPTPGRENYYLCEEPDLTGKVDGQTQRVVMLCGYCRCEAGRALRDNEGSKDAE